MRKPVATYVILTLGFATGAVSMVFLNGGVQPPAAVAGVQDKAVFQKASGTTTENLATIRSLDEAFANLTDFVAPAVVHIRASSNSQRDELGRRMGAVAGDGAGFIYRADGYIITNDHVAGGYDKVTVVLKDGREFEGKVIRAPESDIAVVKISASNLPSLKLAESKKVRPGQFAIAFGTPFGLENSVTIGHVSALGRANTVPDMDLPQGARYYPDMIQTDAAINRGNSGGPLVNIDGQVIGMNTAIFSTTGGSNGVGFAIPSDQVGLIAELLIKDGKLTRSLLGVVPTNLKEYQLKEKGISGGALVEEVQPGSAADKAGIEKGDVVIRIEQDQIRNQIDLRNSMLKHRPGATVSVEVLRGSARKTVSAKLVAPPVIEAPKEAPKQAPNKEREEFLKRFEGVPEFEKFRDEMKRFGEKPRENSDSRLERDVPPLGERPARLGVGIAESTDDIRKAYEIPKDIRGVVVTSVQPDSVAAKLGMKPGDLVQKIGDKEVSTIAELTAEVQKVKPGESKRVKFSRFGKGATTTIELDAKF